MPFTEKPTKMIFFDTEDGKAFIEITFQTNEKMKFFFDDNMGLWIEVMTK